jgi:hypothetical protein
VLCFLNLSSHSLLFFLVGSQGSMPKPGHTDDSVFSRNLLKLKGTKALVGALSDLHDALRDVGQVIQHPSCETSAHSSQNFLRFEDLCFFPHL